MTGRERILAMFEGKPTDRVPFMPITMMFAADQAGVKYGEYARDYRVLVQAQIYTSRKFDFDYVSCISDPAREAADCGAHIRYFDDQPPAIVETQALLLDKSVLLGLKVPDISGPGRMHDRVKAAELFRKEIGHEKLIEGWVEGPCAQAADLRGINNLMLDFFDDPGFVRDLFTFVVEMELAFGRAQIDAGCDLIGIGDAAASLVGPDLYREFVWPFEKQLVQGLQNSGAKVRLHICGNTHALVREMGQLGCEMVDLDYPVSIAAARAAMGAEQVLAGNLDPVRIVRNGTPMLIQEELRRCRQEAGPRYIAAAGCEIPRGTPDENVHAMREAL
ncbi:MAG TPA: uroporphyrinogen decarboxylase family protein [Acidobacteriota bacterium]|nr:uroporphyrinogen decarboxylase family protein [Acidobacteriota bacterium]